MRRNTIYLALALFLAVAVGTLHETVTHAQGTSPQQPGTPAVCQQMLSQRGAMMRHMDAMDSRLENLVAEMNKANGAQKVDAMAKVITEMASQHKDMRENMMQMNQDAMCQMMQGASQGMMNGMMRGMMNNNAPAGK